MSAADYCDNCVTVNDTVAYRPSLDLVLCDRCLPDFNTPSSDNVMGYAYDGALVMPSYGA